MDKTIHRINHYPEGGLGCFVNTYPLDRDLFSGTYYTVCLKQGMIFKGLVLNRELSCWSGHKQYRMFKMEAEQRHPMSLVVTPPLGYAKAVSISEEVRTAGIWCIYVLIKLYQP